MVINCDKSAKIANLLLSAADATIQENNQNTISLYPIQFIKIQFYLYRSTWQYSPQSA